MKTNPVFEQAQMQLDRAKAVYRHALKAVDATLAGVISREPSLLEEARDIQATYIDDITPRELAAAEQPFEYADGGVSQSDVNTPLVDPADVAGATLKKIKEPKAPKQPKAPKKK